MAFARNHQKVSAIPDGADTSLIRPSDWNAAIAVSDATVGGIPYCPTATSEAMSGMTWNAGGAAGEGLVIAAGTAASAVSSLSVTQTWNYNAAAIQGVDWTFTDTSSHASTNAFRIRGGAAGTTDLLELNKAGALSVPGSLTLTNNAGGLNVGTAGVDRVLFINGGATSPGLRFIKEGEITWTSNSTDANATRDTGLTRISAGVIGVGTGAAASVAGSLYLTNIGNASTGGYTTYSATAGAGPSITAGTAASAVSAETISQTWNYAAAAINAVDWTFTDTSSNASTLAFRIRAGAAGTTQIFSIDKNGLLQSGSLTAVKSISNFEATAAGYFFWTGRSAFSSPSDGVITAWNFTNTDFGRMQFGGTTSSFPALKRSGTTLEVKLADDSAYAPIAIGNTVNSVSPTAPNRTVTMVIGGTTYYLHAKTTND